MKSAVSTADKTWGNVLICCAIGAAIRGTNLFVPFGSPVGASPQESVPVPPTLLAQPVSARPKELGASFTDFGM